MSDWIAADYPYTVFQVPGTTGNADGLLEYICEAEPGTASSAPYWRIRKLTYDSNKFNTNVQWASGDRHFDKTADLYLTYSYS